MAWKTRLGDIDYNVPVYPIKGTYKDYSCDYSNAGSAGHNCTIYDARHASGICWHTGFGNWRCRMGDTAYCRE